MNRYEQTAAIMLLSFYPEEVALAKHCAGDDVAEFSARVEAIFNNDQKDMPLYYDPGYDERSINPTRLAEGLLDLLAAG